MNTNSTVADMARLAAQMDTSAIARQITIEEELLEQLDHEVQLDSFCNPKPEGLELRDLVVDRLYSLRQELERRERSRTPELPLNCS